MEKNNDSESAMIIMKKFVKKQQITAKIWSFLT